MTGSESPSSPFVHGVWQPAASASQIHSRSDRETRFRSVIQAFGPVGLSSPGQAAALPASEPAAAKGLLKAPVHFGRLKSLLTARAHFGRFEGLRLEEPLRGFSSVIGCRAGWILSIPRNEQWMVQPYIQPTRPQPPLPGRTPTPPISLPGQHPRRVLEPLLPSERASMIPPPQ